MLMELKPLRYEFESGDIKASLRYDMTAFLRLEERGLSYTDIFKETIAGSVLCDFLRVGGCSDDPEVILHGLGGAALWGHLRNAVQLALPVRDPLIIDVPEEHSGEPDMKQLRCLICDIMRKPEEFFWHSTMRELFERWQAFAVVKGYMKKPERMELYDTEGMV